MLSYIVNEHNIERIGQINILTVTDGAELLKLSKCEVYALAKSGEISAVELGGSIRVIQEKSQNFLKGGKVE